MTRARVRRLPSELADQIAAGEVVARPASVVKELVENSLDAGARIIRVEVQGGGVGLVRVVDDGSGMDPDDAVLALERHATSKVATKEDLAAIGTFGFRGEALPSIASVSRLLLRTRPPERDEGCEVRVTGGAAAEVRPCGSAPGTSVEVADLFYNVPARRKFLRATATESAHVTEVVRAAALAHPAVHIELVRDGRLVRRFLPAPGRAERARETLDGYELVSCRGERGPLSVEAYLALPAQARAASGGLAVFVGSRPVQDRALARAVASAYGDALERGTFPVGVVFLDLPADLVDVNVHPQKAEVRFVRPRAITDAVYSVLMEALGPALARPVRAGPAPAARWRDEPDDDGERWRWSDGDRAVETAPVPTPAPRWQLVGRARERLLVCEGPGGICIVDVRRAQRLALVRRARAELAAGRLVSQRLLFPQALAADAARADAVERAAPELERLGFDLRAAGPRALALHGVPRLFAAGPVEAMALDLLEAVDSGELSGARLGTLLELLGARAATAFCDDGADLVAELGAVPGLLEQAAAIALGEAEIAAALDPDPP
jgi:DNA mismatch repair protein MutL